MERLFIEAKSDLDIIEVAKQIKFSKKLGLVTTVQHLHKLEEVKKLFPDSIVAGTVLGCDVANALKIKDEVDAFLFIGSGNFHPLEIAMQTGKKVLTADPVTGKTGEINEEEIAKRKNRARAAYMKFLASDKIGILVSTKEGQCEMAAAERLKKELKKECYIFVFDTLDFTELENFTDIEAWVSTACPRMAIEDYDKFPKPVINIKELQQNL
ncbi:MAG: 2-(3-amino-3-carboxypropyl)histidine synthase subunit 1/2 [Candidatus Woesearchaeota archaeon]